MFQTRFKRALTLLFLTLAFALSFLIAPTARAASPDFSLSATPTSRTVPRAQDALYTIHVQALNGFTGTVSFSFTGRPNHDSGTFSPTSVTGTGNTTFDMRAAEDSPLGNFTITVIGTSGTLQHTIKLAFNVSATAPDFSMSVSPTSQTINPGGTAIYHIQVQYLNGFTGTINFTAEGVPSPDTSTVSPSSLTSSGTITFTVHNVGATGSFLLFVRGISGGLNHVSQMVYQIN